MVCRENAVSSAVLTRVRIETGLSDRQVIGLLHEVSRSAEARSTPSPSQDEYQSFLQSDGGTERI